ncbi:MAG: hypothetical protein IAG13_18220, partial [Deltaproteobacteria bacterium]|nr:hypothetical protein [Nannocystaceae bacterium]
MHGRRDRFSVTRAAAIATTGIACVVLTACSCAGDPPAAAPVPANVRGGSEQVLNVGNPSRGLDQQPDYDAEARALYGRIAERLPDPLPSAHDACASMLAAAAQLYVVSEPVATAQRAVLRASHAEDL